MRLAMRMTHAGSENEASNENELGSLNEEAE